jgi:hypothetical protein
MPTSLLVSLSDAKMPMRSSRTGGAANGVILQAAAARCTKDDEKVAFLRGVQDGAPLRLQRLAGFLKEHFKTEGRLRDGHHVRVYKRSRCPRTLQRASDSTGDDSRIRVVEWKE